MKQKRSRHTRRQGQEKGVALILALFLMLAMSAVGASMMFLSQSESYSSQNYRLMSQARYGAESGVQVTANYLLWTYANSMPSSTNATDPISNYVTTVSPVTYNGNPVILSANSSVASNYPAASVKTAFTNAVAGTLANGTTTVAYKPYAKLMSMEEVPASLSLSGAAYTIQTWQIVADGNITAGTRTAQVEVTAALDTQKTKTTSTQTFQYGAFATGATCGAIQLSGNGGTNSYTSYNTSTSTFTWSSAGNVGTNGNLTESGRATVNGTLSTPRVGVGSCSAGNIDAETSSGHANVTGGLVHLPQAVVMATPPTPTITGSDVSYTGGTNTLPPGNYNNVSCAGGSTVLQLNAGSYVFNSLTLSGQCTLKIGTGPVLINVAGNSTTSPIDLTGGSVAGLTTGVNAYDASQLQIEYGGTGNVKLAGNGDMIGVFYAPNAPATFTGNGNLYGAVISSTITNGGNGYIYFDSRLQNNTSLFLTTYYSATPTMLSAFSWKTF